MVVRKQEKKDARRGNGNGTDNRDMKNRVRMELDPTRMLMKGGR